MSEWDDNKTVVETTDVTGGAKTEVSPSLPPKVEKKSQKPAVNSEKEQIKYSDDRIKQWLFGDIEKSSSNVCCALYGFDGTAKSGIAMDCRTEQEKKEGWKVIIFDLDGGCTPLKVIYHDNDKNIIIKNPLVRDGLKNVDYEETFQKLKSSLDYIEQNAQELKIKAIIFDGIDKFLKICEYKMREDANKSVADGVDYRYWKLRNQAYGDVMEQIKLLDIDRYFITHLKDKGNTDASGNTIWEPDWEKKTPDMMFQKVRCFRQVKTEDGDKVVYMKATIEKCKTNLALEGKTYTIAETRQYANGDVQAKWYGMYFNKNNSVTQKEVDKDGKDSN